MLRMNFVFVVVLLYCYSLAIWLPCATKATPITQKKKSQSNENGSGTTAKNVENTITVDWNGNSSSSTSTTNNNNSTDEVSVAPSTPNTPEEPIKVILVLRVAGLLEVPVKINHVYETLDPAIGAVGKWWIPTDAAILDAVESIGIGFPKNVSLESFHQYGFTNEEESLYDVLNVEIARRIVVQVLQTAASLIKLFNPYSESGENNKKKSLIIYLNLPGSGVDPLTNERVDLSEQIHTGLGAIQSAVANKKKIAFLFLKISSGLYPINYEDALRADLEQSIKKKKLTQSLANTQVFINEDSEPSSTCLALDGRIVTLKDFLTTKIFNFLGDQFNCPKTNIVAAGVRGNGKIFRLSFKSSYDGLLHFACSDEEGVLVLVGGKVYYGYNKLPGAIQQQLRSRLSTYAYATYCKTLDASIAESTRRNATMAPTENINPPIPPTWARKTTRSPTDDPGQQQQTTTTTTTPLPNNRTIIMAALFGAGGTLLALYLGYRVYVRCCKEEEVKFSKIDVSSNRHGSNHQIQVEMTTTTKPRGGIPDPLTTTALPVNIAFPNNNNNNVPGVGNNHQRVAVSKISPELLSMEMLKFGERFDGAFFFDAVSFENAWNSAFMKDIWGCNINRTVDKNSPVLPVILDGLQNKLNFRLIASGTLKDIEKSYWMGSLKQNKAYVILVEISFDPHERRISSIIKESIKNNAEFDEISKQFLFWFKEYIASL